MVFSPDEILIVEVAVPADRNVVETEQRKWARYTALRDELVVAHKKPTRIIPIVVGITGLVTPNLSENLKRIGVEAPTAKLQKTATIESVKILYNLLGKASRKAKGKQGKVKKTEKAKTEYRSTAE